MVAVLMFVGLWLGPVTAASAHSVLLRTEPAAASVPAAPDAVRLDFNERPQSRFSVVHVTGPDGARRDGGRLSVRNDTVTQPLAGSRPAGAYTVDWRVVSADGHPVSGQWRFTALGAASALAGPAVAQPAPGTTQSSGGNHLIHLLLAIGVAAAIGLVTVFERLRSRRKLPT